jgi:ABC-type antimicrobial peptide transport system permease subunit
MFRKIPPFFGLWSSLTIGLSMSVTLLFTYIIKIPLHPLIYVGYVLITTLIYCFFGFLYDIFLVPLFIKYKIFSTIAYWIVVYPFCRLPHELLTYKYLGYSVFTSDILTLVTFITFFGFLHGVVFGSLIIVFLKHWKMS